MASKVLFLVSYTLALIFMLVVMTSHPSAAGVFEQWFSWYLPVAAVFAVPLGYTGYRGLMAAIAD